MRAEPHSPNSESHLESHTQPHPPSKQDATATWAVVAELNQVHLLVEQVVLEK